MKSLADLLKKRLNSHKLSSEALASQIIFDVSNFLKENMDIDEKDIKPLYVKNGVLWIGISHPAFAQELLAVSDQLIKKIQSKYNKKMVQKIRTKSLTLS